MEVVQVQVKTNGGKSKSLTLHDQGDVLEVFARIENLFELLNKHRSVGEVTITHKV